jgi:hypothetical protein
MKLTMWTDSKEEFLLNIKDYEYYITKDNRLMDRIEFEGYNYDERPEIKDSFIISGLAPYHTTDWLRFYCEEYHPEINFDEEFETETPGVFDRYHEKFGYDYLEWVAQEIYKRFKEELAERGYELPWDE